MRRFALLVVILSFCFFAVNNCDRGEKATETKPEESTSGLKEEPKRASEAVEEKAEEVVEAVEEEVKEAIEVAEEKAGEVAKAVEGEVKEAIEAAEGKAGEAVEAVVAPKDSVKTEEDKAKGAIEGANEGVKGLLGQ